MFLYHLSFSDKLSVMIPRLPDGSEIENANPLYPEPETPRVSFSPTLYKCFLAIYPNISFFFEEENYPHIDMYLYKLSLKGTEGIVYPHVLTKERYVHDAHITDEHWVTTKCVVEKDCKVRIRNTNVKENFYYHPFNDNKEPLCYLGPKSIEVIVLKTFN